MSALPRRRARGFTMVEVMIAVGILVTMAAIVWRSMALTFETKRKVNAVNERYHEGRQTVDRMARELRMAFLRSVIENPLRPGEEQEAAMITRFKGEEDELYFATTAHLRLHANARESDQAEVAYFLRPGEGRDWRGKTLYRRESKRIDDKPDRGGTVWPVLEGVKDLKLEYWDDKKEIADDAWKRTWDSDGDDGHLLPARIRITLVLEGEEGRPDIRFVTQSAPRIRRPIDATARPVLPVP